MSILDTFYLIFKADTKDLKKGTEEADKIVKNLDRNLQSVGKSTEILGGSFLKLANSAANFLAAAVPTAFFTAGIHSAIEMGTEISKTSRLLNVNVGDLQAWGRSVDLAGGDAKQFEHTVVSLGEKFGVTSQQVLTLLPKYANALSRINPARTQQVGKMLGLDEGTILLLQQGSREVGAMVAKQKELNVITEQNKELFLKYSQSTIQIKQAFNQLFLKLAIEALPVLIKIAEKTKEWIDFFVSHKDFVVGGLLGISAAVTVLGVRFAIASLPITLMSALIVGLIGLFALVYDDIQAFMNGQRSIIGYLINHYPKTSQVVYDAFKLMREGFYILAKAADHLMHPIRTLEEALNEVFVLAQKVYGYVGNKLGFNIDSTNETVSSQRINHVLNGAAQFSGGKTTTVTTGDITINTAATDARGISADMISELNRQITQSNNYHSDGVLA